MHQLMIMEMILQKEKDLELAAKIGQSLLEQNHELRTKNEFLEEALNASNDMVVQLRHDLQTRSNLLRFYIDYDIDLDGCTAGQSNNENFQRKIKRLEDENQSLKNESINLKKIFSEFEENEQLHILEWTKQLDSANEKICRLQHSLAEKTEECGIQSFEVERLLREVAVRSSHEKALINETIDLQQKLQDMLAMHEELNAQIVEIQERYTEVLAMLHDAEEELRTYRQNQSAYRTSTPDSLYDSLASEIEASDSGFYTTINSHRMLTREQNARAKMDMIEVSNKLEMIKHCDANTSNLLETRSIATVTDPLPSSDQLQQNSRNDDDVVDVPNHIFAKLLLRQSHPPHLSTLFLGENSTHPDASKESGVPLASKPEIRLFENDATTSTSVQRRQSFHRNSVRQYSFWSTYDLNRISGHNSDPLSKAESNDSLSSYEGPKMGEPGRPGTRDLDWSIKKLNIRKQIEREYARYRRERGLLSSNTSFFNTLSTKISRNSMKKNCLPQIIQQGTLLRSNELQKQEMINDLSRIFKCGKNFSNIGLFASLHDNLSQGVILRSTIPITPPVTPVRQKRNSLICDDNIASSSTYLLEALALSMPPKVLSLSLTSKQLAQFRSMHNLDHNLSTITTTAILFSPEQLKNKLSKTNILKVN